MKAVNQNETESGMTLVETMVAVGVGTIVVLGMTQMMTSLSKQQRNVSLAMDFSSLVSQISMTLNNDKSCQASLAVAGQQFDPNGTNSGLKLYLPGSTTQTLVENPKVVSGWTINSLSITKNASVAPVSLTGGQTQYLAQLAIGAVQTGTNMTRSQSFPVRIVTNAASGSVGTITACYSQSNAADMACTTLGGSYNGTDCLINGQTLVNNITNAISSSCQAQGGQQVGNQCLYNGGTMTLAQYILSKRPAPPASGTNCVGSWGNCSVTCGGGVQTYTVSQTATNGGTACPFANGATQPCNLQACLGNGTCGSANGTSISTAPSGSSLCAAGTPTAISGTGPWYWSCYGTGGGTNAACSATLKPKYASVTCVPNIYGGKITSFGEAKTDANGNIYTRAYITSSTIYVPNCDSGWQPGTYAKCTATPNGGMTASTVTANSANGALALSNTANFRGTTGSCSKNVAW